jgi:hypothetical protein
MVGSVVLWGLLAWAGEGSPELVSAVGKGDLAAVDRLLAAGADPDAPVHVDPSSKGVLSWLWGKVTGAGQPYDTSPLYEAVARVGEGDPKGPQLISRLLLAGADPDATAGERAPVLVELTALAGGRVAVDPLLVALIANGADAAAQGGEGLARLAKARDTLLSTDEAAVVGRLLEAGADPAAALCASARRGDRPLLDVLLRGKVQLDALCPEGEDTPVLAAVRAGQPEIVRTLARAGAALSNPAPPSWHAPLGLALAEGLVDAGRARPVVSALLAEGADRAAPEADGRTPFDIAAPERLAWLAERALSPREEGAALAAWAAGRPVPVELVPASVRAAWSGAALSRSVELFGKQAWVELYATLGAERFAALPTKLGVLARDQRESVVTCPWTIEADKADVDALLGPRQERSRDGDLRVERRAGGTATWLRTIGGRWELLMAEPAPAACSLIPLDLTGLQRAEVLLALGPPDVQWHGSDGWRLRRAEERQPWYWAVRYRGDGVVTGTRLDRRTP